MYKIVGNYKRNSDTSNSLSCFEYDFNETEDYHVRSAWQGLSEISDMEHLYDHIIESINDFKECLYSCNLKSSSSSFSSKEFKKINAVEVRGKLNRRALLLLNMSKLYLDKSCWFSNPKDSFVRRISSCETMHQRVEDFANEIKQNNVNFILGTQLRNYSQHSTLPIDSLTTAISRSELGKLTYSFYLPIRISEIQRFYKKKGRSSKYILDVFEKLGEKEELHSILDGYVFAIGKIHEFNRSLTDSYIPEFKKVIDDLHSKIESLYPNSKYTVLCDLDENGRPMAEYQLGYDWFSSVEYLKEKNHQVTDWNSVEFTEYHS